MASYIYPGDELKLTEGNVYPFKVLKRVFLQDDNEYFILEDPFHLRHFLPAGFYKAYKICTGQEIKCLVDRINCTGRVFLEPDHPYYKTGEKYEFRVLCKEKLADSDAVLLKVLDCFNNVISVLLPKTDDFLNSDHSIQGIVEGVKKGIPEIKIL